MAVIDSNSPIIIFLPHSFEITLMKNDCGVPSCRETSIRPVRAQKLTPWFSVDMTLQPSGST